MNVPIQSYEDPLTILKLPHFSPVYSLFDYGGRNTLAVFIVQTIVDKEARITTADEAEEMFKLLSPLVKDQPDQPTAAPDPEDFAEEQWLMGRLVHLFQAASLDQQYMILNAARKHFGTGGDSRIGSTLPALVFAAFKLVLGYKSNQDEDDRWMKKCERILQFCLQTINALAKVHPELSLRLFLQGALAADQVGSETITYVFISQAFSLYEEEVTDSRAQLAAISLIVGTFERLRCLGEENHETLRTNCAMSSSRLLKKTDQCHSVASCAHLFWSGHYTDSEGEVTECKDSKRVFECLKKAGRIANQCMEEGVKAQLLVELLSIYMHFYEKGNDQITTSVLKQLVEKIRETLQSLESSDDVTLTKTHFENILSWLKETFTMGWSFRVWPHFTVN